MLNQSGEEPVECPLCMEPLEVDDLTFFPCTCGYQICRFCWHRIRTDENGLCPACRKAYPENPADFRPLSREEVVHLKALKKQKDQHRKQKIMQNRKHLANVRVVQRNLVFVVGLPSRLADAEVLKKHEYFGKFGKIQKVVINQSTSYAGSQGPSASAYVTYQKADDSLRAIQAVNNIMVDGRPIRSSLGTTKYCSHFLKNQMCPKQDCMYLHELGDTDASFTKVEMQQGKHQEYEKRLHEQLLSISRERNLVPSMAVTSSIGNCQNTNGSATRCPTCVDSSVKEVWPTRHTGVTTVGHYNESSVSSSGKSKCDNSYRRHKMYYQPSNFETSHTSEEDTKRKEECRNKLTQDGQKSKQIPNLPNTKSHSEHVSDKPNSSEHMNKADLEVLEGEDNLQSRENVGTKLGSNGEKQLDCGRGHLGDRRAPLDDNSFFSASSIVTGGATNVQSVLPLEDWQNGIQLTGSSNSTNVQDWGYNSSPTTSESQLVASSSRLHSITKNDEGGCDITNQNQNSLYVKENLLKSLNRSEIAETFSVDRPEDNDSVTDVSRIQESEKPPVTSSISGASHPHSFVPYDPAILMINQLSGGNNGAQLLFMNGQPSQTTKRFLEDVQIAQQHKERQLQHLQSHCDHAGGEILNMKSKFNASSRRNPRMTAENAEGTIMNGFQNSNDKVENIKGKHPPGFLYHQHKNKDEDVKYIDSIRNPIMSAVQIADNRRAADDELGFDPFHETQKALAEMMEKEGMTQHRLRNRHDSFGRVPEHLNFNHQRAMDECHPVDLFKNRQQHILPQQNHRLPPNITGCTKLRDGLGHNRGTSAGPSLPRRTRLPPPGFASTSNHIQAYGIPQSRSDAGL